MREWMRSSVSRGWLERSTSAFILLPCLFHFFACKAPGRTAGLASRGTFLIHSPYLDLCWHHFVGDIGSVCARACEREARPDRGTVGRTHGRKAFRVGDRGQFQQNAPSSSSEATAAASELW